VTLDGTVHVRRIAYNAKGQRTLIAYGNDVLTRYAYDPHTFRLARMLTQPYTPDGDTFRPTGPPLQDHGYAYDLIGNILSIRDRTPGCGIVNTPAGVDALNRTFRYDPLDRLVSATGRECDLPPDLPFDDRPRGVDLTRTRPYTETYTYDRVGSLLRLAHTTGPAGFVRTFAMADGSNRLTQMTANGTPFASTFDEAGNVTSEATTRHFAWNHADRLVAFAAQTPGAEPSVHAQYLYDASGERVTKLVRRQGGAVEVTHYLGDIEHHRWVSGANNHVHVMDDETRIALVRIGPAAPGDGGVATQFQHGDHLGSTAVVADENGAVTNREEFTPYGETGFGSFARKRYRFTGKERDEESGLNHHSARYLSPWTGRFISVDPHHGAYPQWSPFAYAQDSPLCVLDPTGKDPVAQVRADVEKADAIRGEAESARAELRGAEEKLHAADIEYRARNTEATRWWYEMNDIRRFDPRTIAELESTDAGRAAIRAYSAMELARDARDTAVRQVRTALGKLLGAQSYLGSKSPAALDAAKADPAAAEVRTSLATTRHAVDSLIGEMKQVAKGMDKVKPSKFTPAKVNRGGGGGGGGGGSRGTSIVNELLRSPETMVSWLLMGLDLGVSTYSAVTADTFGQKAQVVAQSTGRWAGMAYGAAACAEFGPFTAAGCGLFGAIFGEAAVKGLIHAVPAMMQAREETFQRIMKMEPEERDFMLRATCLSGGPSCHQ
jgi:RHS repeat-associated protein